MEQEQNSNSIKRTFLTENYTSQVKRWPKLGKHVLAQFTDEYVIVYQAFNPSIAKYAVENQKFGGENYSLSRMTWIKTNFLWMMFRSDWGTKSNQERTLAIYLKRKSFERILSESVPSNYEQAEGYWKTKAEYQKELNKSDIRLQWDPDHHPSGAKHPQRRAIQLGLRGIETFSTGGDILEIRDISDFVKEQAKLVREKKLEELITPKEEVYPVPPEIAKRIGLSELILKTSEKEEEKEDIVVDESKQ